MGTRVRRGWELVRVGRGHQLGTEWMGTRVKGRVLKGDKKGGVTTDYPTNFLTRQLTG